MLISNLRLSLYLILLLVPIFFSKSLFQFFLLNVMLFVVLQSGPFHVLLSELLLQILIFLAIESLEQVFVGVWMILLVDINGVLL